MSLSQQSRTTGSIRSPLKKNIMGKGQSWSRFSQVKWKLWGQYCTNQKTAGERINQTAKSDVVSTEIVNSKKLWLKVTLLGSQGRIQDFCSEGIEGYRKTLENTKIYLYAFGNVFMSQTKIFGRGRVGRGGVESCSPQRLGSNTGQMCPKFYKEGTFLYYYNKVTKLMGTIKLFQLYICILYILSVTCP